MFRLLLETSSSVEAKGQEILQKSFLSKSASFFIV